MTAPCLASIDEFTLYKPLWYALTVGYDGRGHGVVTPTVRSGTAILPLECEHGTVVTLTAMAHPDSTFTGWSGDLNGTPNPASLTMDSPKAVAATFALKTHTLTVNYAGDGSGLVAAGCVGTLVPPGLRYAYGTVVTLTAVPSATAFFAGWSGDLSGTANPITITMDRDKTVTATFTLEMYSCWLPLALK